MEWENGFRWVVRVFLTKWLESPKLNYKLMGTKMKNN